MLSKKKYDIEDVKIIDPDIIRKKLGLTKFNHEKEYIVRNENLKKIKEELEKGYIVISDDLNYYSSMRHDLKIIADSLNLGFFLIHIATPIEVCLDWNEKRGKTIPDKVINTIHQRLDKFGKYNWDIPIATYDISELLDLNAVLEDLLVKIQIETDFLKQEKKLKNIKISSSIDNENLDKITRIFVGKLLKNSNYKTLKKKIINLRKIYIKHNKNKTHTDLEILKSFKEFLERSLNIQISENSFSQLL
ncbi:MAG: hypothetical protein ACFE75_05100 [Candidatus Hodarchaeota archaeon]